jgi:hypothetical protein
MNCCIGARWQVGMLVCLCCLGILTGRAGTYYVATNGPGGDFQSWDTAADDIQDAISAAVNPGDVVLVSNGVYETGGVTNWPAGTVLTNRVAITNAIIVMSANNDPLNTIIKGARDAATLSTGPGAVRCVYMVNGASLMGFTLSDGATLQLNYPSSGTNDNHRCGGVFSQSTNTVISNCVIRQNLTDAHGGGAYNGSLFDCVLSGNNTVGDGGWDGGGAMYYILHRCTVINNYAKFVGGGVGNSYAYHCTIVSNRAGYGGGGAYNSTLYNCLIASNLALRGGGTYEGWIYNCTIVSNKASTAGMGGGAFRGKLFNSIIYHNIASAPTNENWCADTGIAFTNCCTIPDRSGWEEGNITNAPQFIDLAGGNYRLSAGSLCFNTGLTRDWMTNGVDLDGGERIRYGRVDIGCYEIIYSGAIYKFGY